MEYRALPIQNAADAVIKKKLQDLGGDGGVIAIDKFGNIGISFNSEGMYRAYINSDGKPVVEIYKDWFVDNESECLCEEYSIFTHKKSIEK